MFRAYIAWLHYGLNILDNAWLRAENILIGVRFNLAEDRI